VSLRRLSKNAIASVAQVVISAFILFELYRFLMRHLGVEQIGVWSLVMASTAIARLSEFGLGGGVVKFVAGDLGGQQTERATRTISMAVVAIAGVVGAACLALYPVLQVMLAKIVTDPVMLTPANALLPYALGALWLATLSNVFLSALDGCQRSDMRALVMVGAAVGQLLAAYAIVPKHGLLGLGPVQLVQSGLTLVASALFVAISLAQPARAWLGWDRKRFGELVRYGGAIQVAAVGQLLFEPTVKALLSLFGGLALTGYYEMANRMITQFRAVIVSAYQPLVPFVAARAGGGSLTPIEMRNAYLYSYRLLVVLAIPYYALVGASLPIILTLWLGRFDSQFLTVGIICWVGWHLNTMAVPAYMLYLAIGRLRWTVWTQAAIGTLNIVLATFGGWLWGGLGVLVGAMTALGLGSYVTVVAFHREYRVPAHEFFPGGSTALAMVCLIGVGSLLSLAFAWDGQDHIPQALFVGIGLLSLATATLAWCHPMRTELVRRLRADRLPETVWRDQSHDASVSP